MLRVLLPGVVLAVILALPGASRFWIIHPAFRNFQGPQTETPTATIAMPEPPSITDPQTGQNLQGVVEIRGSSAVPGFSRFSLDFAYMDDPTHTWFEITQGSQTISNGVLARWDTRQITDGNYRLRLRVFTGGADTKRFIVEDVRIRNYTSLDTPTPTLTATATATLEPTVTSTSRPTETATAFPTPTQLPKNRAEVSPAEIRANAVRGAVAALALFGVFGLFIRLRRT